MAREVRVKHNQPPDETGAFICTHCGEGVRFGPGTGTRHRNHCPQCLWSRHLDITPGDRRSSCRGAMEPVAVLGRRDGEWQIVHQCSKCGRLVANRIAGDDNESLLVSLAARPLASPPFPLELLGRRPGGD